MLKIKSIQLSKIHLLVAIALAITGAAFLMFNSRPAKLQISNLEKFAEAGTLQCLKQDFPSQYKQQYFKTTKQSENQVAIATYYNEKVIQEHGVAIIFINGGPGVPSLIAAKSLANSINLQQWPLVFFDQRGTGCSAPAFPDISKGQLPNNSVTFNSTHVAGDVLTIIRHFKSINVRRIYLFGHSYGGRIALDVMNLSRNSPDLVAAAYVFGYFPIHEHSKWLLARQKRFQKSLARYLAVYPEDQQKIIALRASLTADDCIENQVSRLCGPDMVDGFYNILAFAEKWSTLHAFIAKSIVNRNGKKLLQTYATNMLETNLQEYLSYSDYHSGVTFTDLCREIKEAYIQSDLIDECRFSTSQIKKDHVSINIPANPLPSDLPKDRITFILGDNDPIVGFDPKDEPHVRTYQGDHSIPFKSSVFSNIMDEVFKH